MTYLYMWKEAEGKVKGTSNHNDAFYVTSKNILGFINSGSAQISSNLKLPHKIQNAQLIEFQINEYF